MPDIIKDSENNVDDILDDEILSEDETDENKEDEDEDGEGGKGKSGSGGKKPLKVNPKELKELIGDEYDTDKWLDKVKAIALGPFSTIIPGASAFDAESDLKKKLLMAEVGILTKQILPSDVADPNLIQQLEARLNLRQDDMMKMAGRITTSPIDQKINTAAAILGATASTIAETVALRDSAKPTEKIEPKRTIEKIETKAESKTNEDIKIKPTETKSEFKVVEDEIKEQSKNQFATVLDSAIKVDKDILDPDLLDLIKSSKDDKYSFAEQIDDGVNTGKPATKPTGDISLQDQFNKAVTEITAPVQMVQLKQDAQFKLNDPASVLRPDPDKFTF